MDKPFGQWNDLKQELQKNSPSLKFREGEVWLCHLGINLGSEEDGKGQEFLRLVLIIRKFDSRVFWALPLTAQNLEGSYYTGFRFNYVRHSVAVLHQLRLLDSRRLKRRVGSVTAKDFLKIINNLKALLP